MTTSQTKLSIPEPHEVNNTLLARRDSTATPGQVWAVIADGWTYSQWVVGNMFNGGRKLTPFRRLKIDPLGVHSSVVDPGTRPRSRSLMRYESPLSAITSAWWTRRSIMAAATTSSPNTSPQRPNGLFEVTIRLARS